ncbi:MULTISPECIES: hypothetical protein [Streptomyces]|uniref:hypothetical protein n=1 Tax=Streptomyces TaxID=1883 RepID=UPI001966CA7D|nr:hypothetical protein JNO44_32085 [Streptomyces noursei]UJB44564.1 hypothetical protein HRD51_30600 [Streptomyces sp. A1-5]
MLQTATDIGVGTTAQAVVLHREYGRGAAAVWALQGSVAFTPGTFTAVLGLSGSSTAGH